MSEQQEALVIEALKEARELLRSFHGYHYDHTEQRKMCVPVIAKISAIVNAFEEVP